MNTRAHRPREEVDGLVARMNAAIAHRGPDAEGRWSDEKNRCHLGHRRLSVIDLSVAANQPMHDATGRYAVVFNGEIYNFKVIRKALEDGGHAFRTQSDTEVLLQAFIVYGRSAFEKFDGMFAVAIYDTQTGMLTLARDRAGEKPLFYAATNEYFAFASELRSLLFLPGFQYRLSGAAMALYMGLRYAPAPYSMLENIHKLEAGCVMEVEATGVTRVHRYFRFTIDDAVSDEDVDLRAYTERVEAAIEESIRVRLISDVPLGAFLSGGIDSSLACAILTQRMKVPVKTYTIGFEADADSEHIPARKIASVLGTDHHEIILAASDFERVIGRIGEILDEPSGDRSCVPMFLLSEFARQHVTVAISGDGGDELYAGYGRYIAFLSKHSNTPWKSHDQVAQAYLQVFLPVFSWQGIRDTLPDEWMALAAFAHRHADVFSAPGRRLIHALRAFDFETYMPGSVLTKVDRMSMQHALETRTPYLAPELYALSRQASVAACIDDNQPKATLRRLAARYLPAEIVNAPKRGFGMPGSVFLQNRERVGAELARSREVLSATNFFRARGRSADTFCKWAVQNTNSVWSTVSLTRWIESVGLNL